jgi:hypothetical protein
LIDWLLKGEPREAQLEALRRSYRGVATMDTMHDKPFHRPVPGHKGEPAPGWGHFLEQRVGKTPTNLNEFALLRRDFGFKWNVVLSPNAFKEDWALEAERFGLDCPAIALDSTKRKKVSEFIDKNVKVGGLIAMNYEGLRSDDNMKLLSRVTGRQSMITADESITLKNPSSGDTKEGMIFAREFAVRRNLSGKPVTQGPHDLWSQLRFIGEANGVTPTVWKARYSKMGGFQGKQVIGVTNEGELHDMLARCSWNARKVDWIVAPPGGFKDYAPDRVIQLLPEQAAMYKRMQTEFLCELADGTIVSADQIITKLIKLQQISSGFIIDEDGNVHELMPVQKNPKVIEVRRMLTEEIRSDAGGKVILVVHYQHTADMLERALAEFQPAVIRGKAWHKFSERGLIEEKKRFNTDPSCQVMIGQEQALRYGHTLMGDKNYPCHNQIYVENNYSLNDRSQTEERAQGWGQTAPVTVWDFICTPQDKRTIEALRRKEDVAATILQYARETGVLPSR